MLILISHIYPVAFITTLWRIIRIAATRRTQLSPSCSNVILARFTLSISSIQMWLSSSSMVIRLTCHQLLMSAQEVIVYAIYHSSNFKKTVGMLWQAWRKHLTLNGLIFHTDQGRHCKHPQFQTWLKNHGIYQSMSRKGNSLDDGLIEGFFYILKRKVLMVLKNNLRI